LDALLAATPADPLTVFAPSNDALAAAITAGLDLAQVELVTATLQYHVIAGKISSTDLAEGLQFPATISSSASYVNIGGTGQVLGVTKSADGVSINFGIPGVGEFTAAVTAANVECSNGIVHIIDKVLMLPKLTSEVATTGGLTQLVNALTKAALADTVNTAASLTIFAPTDAAMVAAGWDALDTETLASVLKYHVVAGTVAYSTGLSAGAITTLEGSDITVDLSSGVKINDATVVLANVLTKNGVVHIIDQVLMPPAAPKSIVDTAIDNDSLSTLVSVITTDDYKPVLDALLAATPADPLTVFAPSNDALAAAITAGLDLAQVELVTATLQYHVIAGKISSTDLAEGLQFPATISSSASYVNIGGTGQVLGVTKSADGVSINFGIPGVGEFTAAVTAANVECSNGIVHIIDKVLMLPKLTSEVATTGGLTQLVNALTKAALADTVNTAASLTIFAPTDAAMVAAGWDALDTETLASVLKYHVVAGTVAYSTGLSAGAITTLEGSDITVDLSSGVKINDATVTLANVLTKNGVVHIIDKVLMPPADSPSPAPTTAADEESSDEETSSASSAFASSAILVLVSVSLFL